MDKRPRVGLGVCIVKDGKVLMGHRVSKHGNDTWSFPGGHIEFGESFEDCAKRETMEEAGIEIKDIEVVTCTNDIYEGEDKHYITVFVKANWDKGEPKVMEPDKMTEWDWFDWDNLPEPFFLALKNFRKTGFRP